MITLVTAVRGEMVLEAVEEMVKEEVAEFFEIEIANAKERGTGKNGVTEMTGGVIEAEEGTEITDEIRMGGI